MARDVRAMRTEQDNAVSRLKQAPRRRPEAPALRTLIRHKNFADRRVDRTQCRVGGMNSWSAGKAPTAEAAAVDVARRLMPILQPPAGAARVPPFQLLNVCNTVFVESRAA